MKTLSPAHFHLSNIFGNRVRMSQFSWWMCCTMYEFTKTYWIAVYFAPSVTRFVNWHPGTDLGGFFFHYFLKNQKPLPHKRAISRIRNSSVPHLASLWLRERRVIPLVCLVPVDVWLSSNPEGTLAAQSAEGSEITGSTQACETVKTVRTKHLFTCSHSV